MKSFPESSPSGNALTRFRKGLFQIPAEKRNKADMAGQKPELTEKGGRLNAGSPPLHSAPRGVSQPCGLPHFPKFRRWRLRMSAALLSGLLLAGMLISASGGSVRSMENTMENRPLKAEDTLQDMLEHPALRSFAKHLLPRPEDAHALCTLGTCRPADALAPRRAAR